MAHDPKQLTRDSKSIVGAAAEETPGAGAVFALVRAVSRRRHEKKFSQYTVELIQTMGLEDHSALAALIEQNQDEDWCAEGFEEGFRTVMSAVDEIAKKCALIMIADYFERHDVPDRIYRQFASLFSEVDAKVLHIIGLLADAQFALGWSHVSFMLVRSADDKPELDVVGGGGNWKRVEADLSHDLTLETCDVLKRARFATTLRGSRNIHPHPQTHMLEVMASVDPHHIPLWVRLHQYLKPLRRG